MMVPLIFNLGGTGVVQEISLDDKLIDKLYIKEGKIITCRIVDVPDYLNGLILRYSPKTQKKKF